LSGLKKDTEKRFLKLNQLLLVGFSFPKTGFFIAKLILSRFKGVFFFKDLLGHFS
jgi:hypothetical protein